jgi:hypothetical protein
VNFKRASICVEFEPRTNYCKKFTTGGSWKRYKSSCHLQLFMDWRERSGFDQDYSDGRFCPTRIRGGLGISGHCDFWPPKQRSETVDRAMAEHVNVDLMASKSRLRFLNANDWVLIFDKAECFNFRKDETLLRYGKQTETLFLVTDGRATVKNGFGVVIARIEPGEICGEMGFLESTYASASVIAEVAMVVYGVAWFDLQNLFEMYPRLASRFYRSLAVSLSQRLRGQISRG